MIIKEVKTYVLQAVLDEPFCFSQGWVHKRSSLIIEVVCENGISGFGECLCHGMQPPQLAEAFIKHFACPRVLGRSIFDVEVIWEELYNLSRPFGQQGVAVNALSGIDIAIWDALGRYLGQPVSNLLGGRFRSKILAYATGFYRAKGGQYPGDAIEEAKRHIANGFRGMKLKAGFGVKTDIEYIRAVRQAIGFEYLLMVDFNCAYNLAPARRLMLELQDCKLEFFEELLAPEDADGYAALRNLTPSYVAAGENLFGKSSYRAWMEKGALDIYQPDLCSSGGYTECKKIAALAQSFHTMLIPHVWGSGIGLAASLQFIASIPPAPGALLPVEPMLEYDQSNHPFRLELIHDSIGFRDGYVKIPDSPGIGVEVNRGALEKYQIR